MYRRTSIEHSRLIELLDYNPDTGNFHWRTDRPSYGGKAKKGSIAGSPSSNGYTDIRLDGDLFKAHRLAWFYVHKEWPPEDIDHINRNKTDNRLCNLRLASRRENNANRILSSRNTSGYKGVSRHKKTGKWVARIRINGKYKSLGLFNDPRDAHDSYKKVAEREFGAFFREG